MTKITTKPQLDVEARRVVLMLLVDFKNSGLDLSEKRKEEIETLSKQVRVF